MFRVFAEFTDTECFITTRTKPYVELNRDIKIINFDVNTKAIMIKEPSEIQNANT